MECIYCKGNNVVKGIQVGQVAEVNDIGLDYGKFIKHTEPMLADLCKDCGTITRLYVENTEKKWIIKK